MNERGVDSMSIFRDSADSTLEKSKGEHQSLDAGDRNPALLAEAMAKKIDEHTSVLTTAIMKKDTELERARRLVDAAEAVAREE